MSRAFIVVLALGLLAGCQDTEPKRMAAVSLRPDVPAQSGWQFSPESEFYGYVSEETQNRVEADARVLAASVCADLAGTLDFLGSVSPATQRVSFGCLFQEPDVRASVPFGELVRKSG